MDCFTRTPPRPPSLLPPRPSLPDAVAAASAVVGDTEFLWVRSPGESADDFISAAYDAAAELGVPLRLEIAPRPSESTVVPLRRQPGGNTAA